MKKVIIDTVIIISGIGVWYLICAFVGANTDFRQWNTLLRIFYITIALVIVAQYISSDD